MTDRSDLFSLGTVFYQMLTGVEPFRDRDPIATLLAVASAKPKAPATVAPDIPGDASALVMRLLDKTPERRPDSARAVAEGIGAIQRTSTGSVPPRARPRALWLAAATAAALIAGAATIITINTGGATVVIRTEHPDVTITIDESPPRVEMNPTADGVAIGVKSGTHTITVAKDGFKPFHEQLQMRRGDRKEPTVNLEPLPRAETAVMAHAATKPSVASVADSPQPFVLARPGAANAAFKHLAGAIAQLKDGDTIEVHGNGPFPVPEVRLDGKALIIRAAPGYRPQFVPRNVSYNPPDYSWFLRSERPHTRNVGRVAQRLRARANNLVREPRPGRAALLRS